MTKSMGKHSLLGLDTVFVAMRQLEQDYLVSIDVVFCLEDTYPSSRRGGALFRAKLPDAGDSHDLLASYWMPLPSPYQGTTEALLYRGLCSLALLLDDVRASRSAPIDFDAL